MLLCLVNRELRPFADTLLLRLTGNEILRK